MRNKTLLITSISPFSKLDHQLRCLKQWEKVGVQVISANGETEAEKLRAVGLPESQIMLVKDEMTGCALFGKSIPRIKPLLARIEEEYNPERCILINSDIFPAIKSSSITDFWCSWYPALALTREECHALEAYTFDISSPYRGGLDAFFFTRESLTLLNRTLLRLPSASRMTFGIPGWDYLLAAVIISDGIGGAIMDSGTLLHLSHRTSYTNVAEFGNYVADMRLLGVTVSDEPARAAAGFSREIDRYCQQNRNITCLAKTMYFKAPPQRTVQPSTSASSVCRSLAELWPAGLQTYRKRGLLTLVERFFQEDSRNFSVALNFLDVSSSEHHRFAQTLLAILLSVSCAVKAGSATFTERYPEGNRHGAELRIILENTAVDGPSRRLEMARLFGAELVDHHIFNRRLYNYLILSCESDHERALLAQIWKVLRSARSASQAA